ncbi:helix-turn-helix domain-containing protein [Sphingomonas sp. MMS24-J45]|uniref:helix-turn-helix domain-containing protein n=1 Tax=Sphingomonas sp. MMS24-J45 TaxID=3238806 RepID=UPI00384CE740
MSAIPRFMTRRPTSVVQFEVMARRIVLPDTAVEFACVDGQIDIIGPMTVARPSSYAVGSRVQLLSLDPVTASSLLGLPLALLTDRIVHLGDISSTIVDQLADGFAEGRIADRLMPQAFADLRPDARAASAASLLAKGRSVAQTAGAVNLGDRQFTRWFHRQLGMHPKRFQRIVRLRRALLAAKQGEPLAAVAADEGFADQAHFNREVRALTGGAPRTILPDVGNVQDVAMPLG